MLGFAKREGRWIGVNAKVFAKLPNIIAKTAGVYSFSPTHLGIDGGLINRASGWHRRSADDAAVPPVELQTYEPTPICQEKGDV